MRTLQSVRTLRTISCACTVSFVNIFSGSRVLVSRATDSAPSALCMPVNNLSLVPPACTAPRVQCFNQHLCFQLIFSTGSKSICPVYIIAAMPVLSCRGSITDLRHKAVISLSQISTTRLSRGQSSNPQESPRLPNCNPRTRLPNCASIHILALRIIVSLC
jgi:hypothetical protein